MMGSTEFLEGHTQRVASACPIVSNVVMTVLEKVSRCHSELQCVEHKQLEHQHVALVEGLLLNQEVNRVLPDLNSLW